MGIEVSLKEVFTRKGSKASMVQKKKWTKYYWALRDYWKEGVWRKNEAPVSGVTTKTNYYCLLSKFDNLLALQIRQCAVL